MTKSDLAKLFVKHGNECYKFDRIDHKRSRFKDVHAFLLLEERFLKEKDGIVGACGRDEICLLIDVPETDIPLSEDDVIELIRCGVRWDAQYGGDFVMYA